MPADKKFTAEELSKLKSRDNIHLLIHHKVYAITDFLDEHPGGDEVLFNEAGKDATDAFEDVGHSDEAREIMEKYLVGTADGAPEGPPAGEAGASLSQRAKTNPVKAANRGMADSLGFLLPLAFLAAFLAYRFYSKSA